MAPPLSLVVCLAVHAAAAAAASFNLTAANDTATDMHDGCIHMQVVHSTNARVFRKRAFELDLANRSDVAYYAKLNFGSPPQSQFVQLDTGSFELWVNPTCTGLSASDGNFCRDVGHFDTSQSSTFSSLNTAKQLRYGIGTANITYGRDDISLPGTSSVMRQVQFGVATSTTDEFSGILGIGYGEGLTTRYANFVDELARQNITRVKAFSLALGSKTEGEGVIVFGGVDTSKFAGSLTRVPITPARDSPDGVPRYWVNMTALSLTAPNNSATVDTNDRAVVSHVYSNSAQQVFLDSGSTLTLLPPALANAIAADFGAPAASTGGYYTVDCSLAAANGVLNFAFNGVTIRVPYSELIRRSGTQCMLGIQASSDFALLGDTFMRSAYVVIDQTNDDVWMTQYTNCGSTPAALATIQSLQTLTGLCTTSTSANNDVVTPTASSSSSSTSTSSSSASSTRTSSSGSTASSAASSSASLPNTLLLSALFFLALL